MAIKVKIKDLDEFKILRVKSGKNATEFAEAIGISKQAIYLLESGNMNVSPANAKKIIEFLKVEFDELFVIE